jgi:protein gp37
MRTWHRHQIYTFDNHSDAAMFFLQWGGRVEHK